MCCVQIDALDQWPSGKTDLAHISGGAEWTVTSTEWTVTAPEARQRASGATALNELNGCDSK